MNHKILGLLIGGLTLAATASPAYAAKVTVEVEGQGVVVGATTVQTPASVSKNTETCANGASALGALDAVTNGNWLGQAYGMSAPDTILGEAHPIAPNQASWVYLVNGKTVNDVACNAAVSDGDTVLWYWSNGFDPYKAPVGYDDPVLLDGPATAVPGRPVRVKVRETHSAYDAGGSGSTTIVDSAGASVAGATATATTGADGSAEVSLAPGPYTLVATKGNRAPARFSGCATTGSDGFCGTTATPAPPPPAAPCVTKGDDGFCGSPDKRAANAAFTALPEGKKYKKGKGPRELKGHVADEPSGIADVRVRLTRRTTTHACSTFDAKKERFVAMKKCGATHGTWFSVGAKQDFTYLLPSKLGAGRYVLDLNVVDKAGNKTAALARGTSRVVFTVG